MNLQTQSESQWTRESIQSRVRELGEWFHNLELEGVQTAPNHFLGDYPKLKWNRFAAALAPDLSGKSVLDIGCNAGFYSLEMKRRGASRVLGIDTDERYLKQARFAAEVTGLDVEWRQLSVYQLEELAEQFDIVLFLGVLYHLRHPLLALDLIRRYVARDLVVVQSMLRGTDEVAALAVDYPISNTEVFECSGFPKMYFVENSYSADPTNWWIPNRACLQAMIRSAGFEILQRPEREVLIAKVDKVAPHVSAELIAAGPAKHAPRTLGLENS